MEALLTPHLRAEPLHRRHEVAHAELLGDALVGATLGGVRSAREAAVILGRHVAHWEAHGFGLWAFTDRATGAFVGRGGPQRTQLAGRDEVELAWAVVADRWGEGLATEMGALARDVAFARLGLPDVVAVTLPRNAASRRVMEKLGLAYERDIVHAGVAHVMYRRAAPRGWVPGRSRRWRVGTEGVGPYPGAA